MIEPRLTELQQQKQKLQHELEQLVERRSQCATEADRLKLIPEAVRITGAISGVERKIEEFGKQ